jgi:hypothetical protein
MPVLCRAVAVDERAAGRGLQRRELGVDPL